MERGVLGSSISRCSTIKLRHSPFFERGFEHQLEEYQGSWVSFGTIANGPRGFKRQAVFRLGQRVGGQTTGDRLLNDGGVSGGVAFEHA